MVRRDNTTLVQFKEEETFGSIDKNQRWVPRAEARGREGYN
jgi:hypothetical protein